MRCYVLKHKFNFESEKKKNLELFKLTLEKITSLMKLILEKNEKIFLFSDKKRYYFAYIKDSDHNIQLLITEEEYDSDNKSYRLIKKVVLDEVLEKLKNNNEPEIEIDSIAKNIVYNFEKISKNLAQRYKEKVKQLKKKNNNLKKILKKLDF